jgi:predicted ribosomally synthesized peptide with nif11-like leader
MSLSEVQRFAQDLKSNADLLAATKGSDLGGVVRLADQRGYKFTLAEARDFMRANAKRTGKTLTDEEMDRVAGGAGVCSTCKPGRTKPGQCSMGSGP